MCQNLSSSFLLLSLPLLPEINIAFCCMLAWVTLRTQPTPVPLFPSFFFFCALLCSLLWTFASSLFFFSSLSSFLLLTYHSLPSPPLLFSSTLFLFYSFTLFIFLPFFFFTRGNHRTHPHIHASSLFSLSLYISKIILPSLILYPSTYLDLNK